MNVKSAGFFTVVIVVTATHAFAGQAWEIEAHGGVLMSANPDRGTSSLPPAGPNIPVNGPLPASITRQVPSWYFGDGAAILNQILGPRSPVQLAPLDPVLTSRFVDRESGGSAGIRIDLGLTPRFGAEFAFDAARGSLALRSSSKTLVAASAASFSPVWNTLLGFPGSNLTVTSDATLDDNRGHQLITTGSLLVNLLTKSAFVPYVTVGAGYIAAGDDAPSVTLVGNYTFTLSPTVPLPIPPAHINQTDTVKVQAIAKNTMTAVFGAGVKYALGERWGVRADLRDYVNRDVVRTVVSTTPTSVFGTPSGTVTFAFTQTAPLIVFSTSPLTGSTLSTSLNDVQTFRGRGIVNQVNATAGIYWRF